LSSLKFIQIGFPRVQQDPKVAGIRNGEERSDHIGGAAKDHIGADLLPIIYLFINDMSANRTGLSHGEPAATERVDV